MRKVPHSQTLFSSAVVVALFFLSVAKVSAPEPEVIPELISEMEAVFGETSGMIKHTMTVLGHAMEISAEEGGDALIVRASAILHDIGIPRAREVHGSSSGQYQEIEGPPIAREILTKHQVSPGAVDHICGIVANHHSDKDPEIVNTVEFKILWDSDWLGNFPGRDRRSRPDARPRRGSSSR